MKRKPISANPKYGIAFVLSFMATRLFTSGLMFWACVLVGVGFVLAFLVSLADSLPSSEDDQKSKLQAEQNRKGPILHKKSDPFLLLAQSQGHLLTVKIGDTAQEHTKVGNTWYRSVQLDTFEYGENTFQVVALKPDPLYQSLVDARTPQLHA